MYTTPMCTIKLCTYDTHYKFSPINNIDNGVFNYKRNTSLIMLRKKIDKTLHVNKNWY